jgi:hypothetical protein
LHIVPERQTGEQHHVTVAVVYDDWIENARCVKSSAGELKERPLYCSYNIALERLWHFPLPESSIFNPSEFLFCGPVKDDPSRTHGSAVRLATIFARRSSVIVWAA